MRPYRRKRNESVTFGLPPQWQQTVHRYLRVLQSRIIKSPPKKVTMDEARKAHHMRCPLSQGTSMVMGMMSALDTLTGAEEESAFRLLLALMGLLILMLPLPPPPPPE